MGFTISKLIWASGPRHLATQPALCLKGKEFLASLNSGWCSRWDRVPTTICVPIISPQTLQSGIAFITWAPSHFSINTFFSLFGWLWRWWQSYNREKYDASNTSLHKSVLILGSECLQPETRFGEERMGEGPKYVCVSSFGVCILRVHCLTATLSMIPK